ncbi:MAG: cytochrome-c oxidase, cbb3-type subunit III [Thiotrichaceae bacterium]|nr:cytochrome-c oxidase, cbb3-type subunit III [Thiotrichaceae bacterium]
MFESSLFTSQFWEWFIIIPTVLGIIACFALIIWLGGGRPKDGKVKTMGHVWDGDLAELNNPLPRWWLYMFYLTLIFSIIYLILYPGLGSFAGILNWSETNAYEEEMAEAEARYGPIFAKYAEEPIETLVQKPDAIKLGHSLYMTYCTTCHGSDARGVRGFPNLRDDDWLYGGQATTIETTIMHGRNGNMPTAEMNGLKTKADINNITQYVISLSRKPDDRLAAVQGEKIFKRVCFACHGMTGTGFQALGAPNLTDDISLYGASRSKIRETITYGRQGKMPAHGDFLGKAKVHLLATYIYSLSLKK